MTSKEKVVSDLVKLRLPFMEFERKRSNASKTIDAYTPELGRTKTAIESFDYEYKGIFGDIEVSGHDLRVHTPKGKAQEAVFFGSDENFSADFVVENLTEKWTNHEEMQNYMGILDALSEGRWRIAAAKLKEGEFRDVLQDDIGIIDRLFNVPKSTAKPTLFACLVGWWLAQFDIDAHEDDLFPRLVKFSPI